MNTWQLKEFLRLDDDDFPEFALFCNENTVFRGGLEDCLIEFLTRAKQGDMLEESRAVGNKRIYFSPRSFEKVLSEVYGQD